LKTNYQKYFKSIAMWKVITLIVLIFMSLFIFFYRPIHSIFYVILILSLATIIIIIEEEIRSLIGLNQLIKSNKQLLKNGFFIDYSTFSIRKNFDENRIMRVRNYSTFNKQLLMEKFIPLDKKVIIERFSKRGTFEIDKKKKGIWVGQKINHKTIKEDELLNFMEHFKYDD
tara:strand:+ start:127912 stop:128424 length:513 start_codon:yes stop_codon:yes gene_type:complete